MSKPSDLVQGTLDLPLLKILALQPTQWLGNQPKIEADIRRGPSGERRIFYPALHKREQEGWRSAAISQVLRIEEA